MVSQSESKKILASVEANRKELVRTCSELVQINTENPQGDCTNLISYLRSQYRNLGVNFRTISASRKSLESRGLSYPRENFVASLGDSRKHVGLGIGTHMDVVPAGPKSKWRYLPFSGKIAGGKIWGRGACDAKCSLAAQLFAIRALIESNLQIQKSMISIGTVDDEAPNDAVWPGMEFMAKEGLKKLGFAHPEFMINAEASGLQNIWGIFLGNLTARLEFKGKVGHPPLGINALESAISFWGDISSKESAYGRPRLSWLSGGSDSDLGLTPENSEMIFSVSQRPGTTPTHILRNLREIIKHRNRRNSVSKVGQIKFLSKRLAFDVGRKNRVVSILKRNANLCGIKASYGGGIVGSGDLYPYLERGIPGVTFGAGGLERCHVPDEFVFVEELINQTKIYALTSFELCGKRDLPG